MATTSTDSNPANSTVSLVTTVDARPVITTGPTNLAVAEGATAIFSVTATGTPAPGYQWFLNATNPVGVNSNVLTLTDVGPAQAGSYTVLVTNVAGETNSAPASLTLLQQPTITKITATGANVSVSFQSVSNLNYTLEYKNQLTNGTWIILSPSLPGNGGVLMLQDTNALPTSRFYRILIN